MEHIRKPIISRTAIYQRITCCSDHIKYEGCNLCNSSPCKGSSKNTLEVMYITQGNNNWDDIINKIWSFHDEGKFLRLIIDTEIPKEVLWAASYSEKNIFQVNINMIELNSNIDWIRKLVFMSGNCGLYVVLFLYPIIPDLVKTYHVIDVIDMFRNVVQFHVNLKFGVFTKVQESEEYINFNSIPVSIKHLKKCEDSWECTPEYLKNFLDIVNLYAIPRKISVGICGENTDCTGLGG